MFLSLPEECACCGRKGWKPTRREVLTGGVGLTAALAAGIFPEEAQAVQGHEGICRELYNACIHGNCDYCSYLESFTCQLRCELEQIRCRLEGLTRKLQDALSQAVQWVADHPLVVAFVIAGVAFIVLTGGAGAPILAFA